MPRQPRIDYPGAWHHVTNRGRNKQAVYRGDNDRADFLDHFATASRLYQLEVHSFCLMDTHFHSLVRSLTGQLSNAMQFVGGQYTVDFNQRHGTDGALFKGRFFSKIIEDERYLMEAARYIPNNPVKAGIVMRPEHYQWSSYAATVGIERAPEFLDADTIVDWFFGGDRASFASFVAERDTQRSHAFAHAVESRQTDPSLRTSISRIADAERRFQQLLAGKPGRREPAAILARYVCGAFELPLPHVLYPIDSRSESARHLLLTLLYRHEVAPLAELGSAFGVNSRGAAHRAVRRFERTASNNPILADLVTGGINLIPSAA